MEERVEGKFLNWNIGTLGLAESSLINAGTLLAVEAANFLRAGQNFPASFQLVAK